jgi:hypothetical protein
MRGDRIEVSKIAHHLLKSGADEGAKSNQGESPRSSSNDRRIKDRLCRGAGQVVNPIERNTGFGLYGCFACIPVQ